MAKTMKRIVVSNAIGHWVNFVFKAREPKNGKPGKFGVTLAIPKERSAEWAPLRALLFEALKAKHGMDSDGHPIPDEQITALIKAGKFKWPIHDGDVEMPGDKNFAGMIYLNASSKTPPGIVDAKKKRITSEEFCFSGCILNADLAAYAFDNESKGVALALNNIQVVRFADVKRLDNKRPPEDAFEEVEGDTISGGLTNKDPSAASGGSIAGLV